MINSFVLPTYVWDVYKFKFEEEEKAMVMSMNMMTVRRQPRQCEVVVYGFSVFVIYTKKVESPNQKASKRKKERRSKKNEKHTTASLSFSGVRG